LAERVAAARAWLATYAPDRSRVAVQPQLPAAAADLSGADRAFLASLADRLEGAAAWSGEVIQDAVFDAARAGELAPGTAFATLYRAFLGQPSGPRAGWLLASLEPAFVRQRLRAAAAPGTLA
jgi:lysyl-tRNA synthetase class I